MRVISNAGTLPERYKNVVAAIGVFDGVHRGHQLVIGRAVEEARRISGTSVVVTFYPHPVAILRPADFDGYVMSLEQRIREIAALGADVCYVLPFDRSFSRLSVADFAKKYLIGRLRALRVVVGEDFHFGFGRGGTAGSFLALGLQLTTVPLLKFRGINIKTRRIKQFIAAGDLRSLKTFLGRNYGISGRVGRGKGVGRQLGYPTANLHMENIISLPSGIYAVRVMVNDKQYDGVFYIGIRPTIKKHRGVLGLEAHLFDFKGDLYGKKIMVEVLKKIRGDRLFPDSETLSRAIARDVVKVRDYLSHHLF